MGGYLVPDDFSGIAACFSPGVSTISGFEKDIANMGIKVFLADRSVSGPAENHNLFNFTKKYIGITSNEDFITMDKWVNYEFLNTKDDLLLQMDIEGYEYEVLLGISENLLRCFRIMVIEVHDLKELFNKPFFIFKLASRMFEKILQTHSCVHNHPNNYCGSVKIGEIEIPLDIELTFLRNNRIRNASLTTSFPHPLDFNNSSGNTLVLPNCWYRYGNY